MLVGEPAQGFCRLASRFIAALSQRRREVCLVGEATNRRGSRCQRVDARKVIAVKDVDQRPVGTLDAAAQKCQRPLARLQGGVRPEEAAVVDRRTNRDRPADQVIHPLGHALHPRGFDRRRKTHPDDHRDFVGPENPLGKRSATERLARVGCREVDGARPRRPRQQPEAHQRQQGHVPHRRHIVPDVTDPPLFKPQTSPHRPLPERTRGATVVPPCPKNASR